MGTASALVFNTLFFPTTDPVVGTMPAFSTYAVGFAARPVGAAVLGLPHAPSIGPVQMRSVLDHTRSVVSR